MKWFKNLFKNRGEELVAQYWREDAERKQFESRFKNYSSENVKIVMERIKEYLEQNGMTNIMIRAEKLEGPRIIFKYRDKEIVSDEIFDFTYDKIIENINEKIKM